MDKLARAVIQRTLDDLKDCPQWPAHAGDDYRKVRPLEWLWGLQFLLSEEPEWKGARLFWLGLSGLNDLEVRLEALVYWVHHSMHEPRCQQMLEWALVDNDSDGRKG